MARVRWVMVKFIEVVDKSGNPCVVSKDHIVGVGTGVSEGEKYSVISLTNGENFKVDSSLKELMRMLS